MAFTPRRWFSQIVSQAFLSRSITAVWQKPAFDTPIAKPPTPLNSSTELIISILLSNGGY